MHPHLGKALDPLLPGHVPCAALIKLFEKFGDAHALLLEFVFEHLYDMLDLLVRALSHVCSQIARRWLEGHPKTHAHFHSGQPPSGGQTFV